MNDNSDGFLFPVPSRKCGLDNIVKVGGSLLDLPDLPARLLRLLSQFDRPSALVIGGGAAADAVRGWSAVFGISEPVAHWLAVDSLSLTARLVCGLLNREVCGDGSADFAARVVDDWSEACEVVERGMIPVLNPRGLLESATEDPQFELPESWAATSDSIAAAIAIRWGVPQLVLGKSVDAPTVPVSSDERPADSAVDAWFRQLAPRLNAIQWCNLREPVIRCLPWRPVEMP
jgi:aspartokinase-like uncharacterized kinase